ncbi:MAG: hypothetical protein WBE40_04740 [Thermoplasmata archaeon]
MASIAPSRDRPPTVLDTGERWRLAFWEKHCHAIQSDLLEITGWMGRSPDREVLTEAGGKVRFVRAGTAPANVLFRVPREGTRAYQNWEWCLGYLRMEQSRRWLVRQQVEEAERALQDSEEELKELRARHRKLDSRLRSLAVRARADARSGSGQQPNGPLAQLQAGMAEARENLAVYRVAERHRDTIRLRLEGHRDHLVPRVYPGLWARVNAFLDLQALSVANVASEEFRRHPQLAARWADRREQALAEDESLD